MSESSASLRRRNLRTLALLAGLFLVPLLFAFGTYYGTAWRPAGHVNHGTLITPARPLPQTQLPVLDAGAQGPRAGPFGAGRWTLAYLGAGSCSADCRQVLVLMRQTRLALNTDMGRVRRVFLVTSACCARAFLAQEHPGLAVVEADTPAAAALLAQFPAERAHTLFVVDPLGNLMMSYDARSDPHGLLEDLKKLLRLSQIG
jgi:hypothetical protein